MSLRALTWALEHPACPSAAAKLVLIALANYMDPRGWAWPASTTISALTKLDIKTVRSALDALERDGLIVDTTRRVGATRQVKVYALMVPPAARPESHPDTGAFADKATSHPDTGALSRDVDGKAPNSPPKGTQKREAEPPKEPLSPPPPSGAAPQGAACVHPDQDGKGEQPAPAAGRKGRKAAGTTLPVDWQAPPMASLPPTIRQIVEGWPYGALAMEAEAFAAHFRELAELGSPKARHADWGRTWANWLRKGVGDVARNARLGVAYPEAASGTAPVVAEDGCDRATAIKAGLAEAIGQVSWAAWVAPCRFAIADRRLLVRGSGVRLDHIRNQWRQLLEKAAGSAGLELHFVVEKRT